MPLAVASRPSACARLTTFAEIAVSFDAWRNERLTLILSTGKLPSWGIESQDGDARAEAMSLSGL